MISVPRIAARPMHCKCIQVTTPKGGVRIPRTGRRWHRRARRSVVPLRPSGPGGEPRAGPPPPADRPPRRTTAYPKTAPALSRSTDLIHPPN